MDKQGSCVEVRSVLQRARHWILWSLESGVWSLYSGVWTLESGVWSLDSGAWSTLQIAVLKELGERLDTVVFHAPDFGPSLRRGSASRDAETVITRVVLSTAHVRYLHVENARRAPKFQEVAVMAWCLYGKHSLEDLTIVDAPNDLLSGGSGGMPGAGGARGEEGEEDAGSEGWKLEHASRCKRLQRLHLDHVVFDYQYGLNCRCVPLPLLCSALLCYCSPPRRPALRALLAYLELVIDCFPQSSSANPAHELWGSIIIKSGNLRELLLDLNAPFNLRVNPEAVASLRKLELSGDDWPWSTARELLEVAGQDLEFLNLAISLDGVLGCTPVEFFRKLPSLKYLSMNTEIFYFLCHSLGATSIIHAPELREFHMESVTAMLEELKFVAALLKGSPHLRVVQPIHVTLHYTDGGGGAFHKPFQDELDRIRRQYPRKQLLQGAVYS
eukprot:jgi/Mesen1/3449/ME000194S02595